MALRELEDGMGCGGIDFGLRGSSVECGELLEETRPKAWRCQALGFALRE